MRVAFGVQHGPDFSVEKHILFKRKQKCKAFWRDLWWLWKCWLHLQSRLQEVVVFFFLWGYPWRARRSRSSQWWQLRTIELEGCVSNNFYGYCWMNQKFFDKFARFFCHVHGGVYTVLSKDADEQHWPRSTRLVVVFVKDSESWRALTGTDSMDVSYDLTLPETKITLENRPLEKRDSYWKPNFLG